MISPVLIISSIVLLIGITSIAESIRNKKPELLQFGFFLSFFIIILGFIFGGMLIPVKTTQTILPITEYIRSSQDVIFYSGTNSVKSSDVFIYNNPELFQMIHAERFSSYNNKLDETLTMVPITEE